MSNLATNDETGTVRKLLQDAPLLNAQEALSLIDRYAQLSWFEESLEHMARIYRIRAGSATSKGRDHMGWAELVKGLEFELIDEPTAKMRLYFYVPSETDSGPSLLIFTNSATTKLLGVLVGTGDSDNQTALPLDERETELAGN